PARRLVNQLNFELSLQAAGIAQFEVTGDRQVMSGVSGVLRGTRFPSGAYFTASGAAIEPSTSPMRRIPDSSTRVTWA
ncbi:MAG: hypothetical protein ACXW2Q_01015, partial [Thermoanaerobaculia bacterium]